MSIEAPLHIVTADPHTLALSIRASCLVFEDPASKALLDRAHRIGPSDATALIIGETGTGKELITRHIHELSDRRSSPFAAINKRLPTPLRSIRVKFLRHDFTDFDH
jgi:sigma-54-specific transcriptional regulator